MRRWIATALELAVVVGVLAVYVGHAAPLHNWDLLPYVGIAHRLDGASTVAAHRATYDGARAALPARDYELLAGVDPIYPDPYRQAVAADPEAFAAQQPLYALKLIYPVVIRLVATGRDDPAWIHAALDIPPAAYLALGVVVWWWLRRLVARGLAVVVTAAVMATPFALDLARLATPDALSTLVLLGAVVLWLEHDRPRLGLGLMGLGVAIRPDAVLWLAALATATWLVSPRERAAAVAAVVAGAALYAALTTWSGYYGWPTLFYVSFVDRVVDPAAVGTAPTLHEYLAVLARQGRPADLPPYHLVGLTLAAVLVGTRALSQRWIVLVSTLSVAAVTHWALFPARETRLVVVWLLVVCIGTVAQGARAAGVENRPARERR